MTDKTAEIHLNQLTVALEFLVDSWDRFAGGLTRHPESRSKEDNVAAVNLYAISRRPLPTPSPKPATSGTERIE